MQWGEEASSAINRKSPRRKAAHEAQRLRELLFSIRLRLALVRERMPPQLSLTA